MARELEIVQRYMAQPPVNVVQIIRDLGIRFRSQPMRDGKSGYIEHEDGQFTITVNSSEGSQRQRFTAAHELAHYLLHRDLLVERGGLARHDDSLFGEFASNNPAQPFRPSHEVEANKLAAQIIMPKEAVSENYVPDFDNVEVVSELFGVSEAAMAIRLRTLGLRRGKS